MQYLQQCDMACCLLRSRKQCCTVQEDLEGLFASVREAALTQNPEDGADRIKSMMDVLRTRVKRDCGGRPTNVS